MTIERKAFLAFFAGLLGVARGQQLTPCYTTNPDGCPRPNGRCPVCGTMVTTVHGFVEGPWRMVPCAQTNRTALCFESEYLDPGPRIERCRNCSNAFWVDAEKAK